MLSRFFEKIKVLLDKNNDLIDYGIPVKSGKTMRDSFSIKILEKKTGKSRVITIKKDEVELLSNIPSTLIPDFVLTAKNRQENKPTVLANGFVLAKAVDVYHIKGSPLRVVAREKFLRDKFQNTHQLTTKLLCRDKCNPVTEEGFYIDDEKRDRTGEYSLTHEFLALFVYYKLIKNAGKHYDKDNIYVINDKSNDGRSLYSVLKQLSFAKEGDNAKIIYIRGWHSNTLYIRNHGDKLYCYIMDTGPNLVMETALRVLRVFPSIKVIYGSDQLQVDYSTCGVFSLKALMYFSKHGERIFKEVSENGEVKRDSICPLPPGKMPAAFYKLTQKAVPDVKVAKAIVSQKRGLSLADYLAKGTIKHAGHHYNIASISKKYSYMHQLEELLTENLSKSELRALKQSLKTPGVDLPAPCKTIIDEFVMPSQYRVFAAIHSVEHQLMEVLKAMKSKNGERVLQIVDASPQKIELLTKVIDCKSDIVLPLEISDNCNLVKLIFINLREKFIHNLGRDIFERLSPIAANKVLEDVDEAFFRVADTDRHEKTMRSYFSFLEDLIKAKEVALLQNLEASKSKKKSENKSTDGKLFSQFSRGSEPSKTKEKNVNRNKPF